MDKRIKIILLWLLLIVCMILHFDYHISKAVYGIDIQEAGGSIPPQLIWIRTVFHFLPLLYIAMLLYFEQRMIRLFNLVVSGLYTVAHAFHFTGELRKANDPSQMALLGITLLLSLLLAGTSYSWWQHSKQ